MQRGLVLVAFFQVSLSGQVRFFAEGSEVEIIGSRPRALLGILALMNLTPIGRDKLSALLWGERTQSAARASLRQTLRRLKRCLGPYAEQVLNISTDGIGLVSSTAIKVDVLDALAEVRNGQACALLDENPAAFTSVMEGLDHIDANFANWIAVRRQRMHQDAVDALGDALSACLPEDPRAHSLSRLLLKVEPTHEAACRRLMRMHQANGNAAGALAVYQQLWETLDQEYDTLPSEETQRLIVEIKQNTPDGPAPSDLSNQPAFQIRKNQDLITAGKETKAQDLATVNASHLNASITAPHSEGAPPVIQVEQFTIAGIAEDQRLMALGFRIDIIAALCRFREWRVVDTAEVTVGSDVSWPGIRFGLSGAAVSGGDGFSVILAFRDLSTGEVVWSERVDLGAADWNRALRRAVRRIAVALSLHLSVERLAMLSSVPDAEASTHHTWLLGQAMLSSWRPDSEDRAETIFRTIIHDQPSFAPAFVGLTEVLNTRHLIRPGMFRSRSTHQESLALALRAVAIDPLDSRAQLALAWSFALNGAWDNALHTFGIAGELNENDPWAMVSSSLGYAYCGDHDSAKLLSQQIVDLGLGTTPLQWAYHAGVRFLAGDYSDAALAAGRGAGSTPYIGAWQAAALGRLGRTDEARSVLSAFLKQAENQWAGPNSPTPSAAIEWLLHCYPIRSSSDWDALRDGLAAAGAPVPEQRPSIDG